MSRIYNVSDASDDLAVIAIKPASQSVPSQGTTTIYSYGQTSGANPDAPSQLATGNATTSYLYDLDGNVTQAGAWNYAWDYLNRMLSSTNGASQTSYGYDASGARMFSKTATSTTFYPSKFFSRISTQIGSSSSATSTDYIFAGDTLLATIDQPMKNGATSSAPIVSYMHPDHLGSTNVVTSQSGGVTQILDYYPYGATRVSQNNSQTSSARQFIGQFSDAQTGLDYLNARYYDSARGQFMSQDPVFWEIGVTKDGKMSLAAPQIQNAYSYAQDNPVRLKDPDGRFLPEAAVGAVAGTLIAIGRQGAQDMYSGHPSSLSTYTAAAWGGFVAGGIIGGN